MSNPASKTDAASILISFFVPCFNEEQNIENTLEVIREAAVGIDYEIIVVDDGSTDLTSTATERYIALNPEIVITLIKRAKNVGLGANYLSSAQIAKGTHFMLVNGDNVEPVESLETIIGKVGQADMVIPNFGNADKRKWNRRALSSLFTSIVNCLSGNRISYYNGPVLHLRKNVLDIGTDSFGYGYQAETLCKLLRSGATYLEIIVPMQDREMGASKAFTLKNLFSVSSSLGAILISRIKGTNST